MKDFLGREAEAPAKEGFSKWLEEMGCPRSQQNWGLGKEPPDYFLTITGKKFAVEVISLIDSFGSVDPARTFTAIEHEWDNFREYLEPYLKKIVPLFHTWLVEVFDVPSKKNWESQRKALGDAIKLCEQTSPPLKGSIRSEGFRICNLGNCAQADGMIEVSWVDYGGWVLPEAQKVILRALESKADKLKEVPKPWILLCWKSGFLLQRADYKAMLETADSPPSPGKERIMKAASEYESVFIADPSGADLLYGNSRFWM